MVKRDRLCVCVCIPSTMELWRRNMGKSLALMAYRFGAVKVPNVREQTLVLQTLDGSTAHSGRELLVRKALEDSRITHLLWIDSDMSFPPDTLHRLLAHNEQFVAANCTTRTPPIQPVAFDLNGHRLDSRGKAGIEEVQHVGLAVALVDIQPVKQLRPPLFLPDWIPTSRAYCGEDVYFTQKLREVGVKLYIDHGLSQLIKHGGHIDYGHDDVREILDGPISVKVA